jgi:hypothetical protein
MTLSVTDETASPTSCSDIADPASSGPRAWHPAAVTVVTLASYRRCCEHLAAAWPAFLAKREERLEQRRRFGTAAEKVAENIVEDLFTMVLDWQLTEINNQVGHADMVLTRLSIKQLIVEVKRPGALVWNERAMDLALGQARRYADEQRVRCVAASDGAVMYARDLIPGGHRDRLFVRLDQPEAPLDLWWLSADGIYRPREFGPGDGPRLLPESEGSAPPSGASAGIMSTARAEFVLPELLHPKYLLPARCFAYVGDANDSKTWHLPYLKSDGTPDASRLPKAIQAILSNYRGTRVGSVPENAIPEVLVTLARTARGAGRFPAAGPGGPQVYVQLQAALEQFDRLDEVLKP